MKAGGGITSPEPGRATIRFLLDDRIVEVHDPVPTRSLLDFLREDLGCTGTKEGCAEGDCGACNVVVGERVVAAQGERLRLRALAACLCFLPTLDGKALFTVESLKAADGVLHPVQQALVECHGSQCGFCTPGFVMSLFALFRSDEAPTAAAIRDALAGNLCRCTGYRPIVEAGARMYALGADERDWLRRPGAGSEAGESERALLARLVALERRDPLCIDGPHVRFDAPTSLAGFAALCEAHPEACILAGGTDAAPWVRKRHRPLPHLIHVGRVEELKRIVPDGGGLEIGAGASLRDAFAALDRLYPELAALWRRFGAMPVRNAGTLGGNIANASPVGDATPILIALGASLLLRRGEAVRELALGDFHRGYRQTALTPGEFIEAVRVPRPQADLRVRGYKVARRHDQDVAAVSAGFALRLDGRNVCEARLAWGGMAATPKRAPAAEVALLGRPWDEAAVRAAMAALEEDFRPIDDLRASSTYRMKVAQNLLMRLWLETRREAPLAAAQVDLRSLG